VILYDGACGLCARGVQLVLRRDRRGRFRFASLQSDYGRAAFGRHGLDPSRLDTWGVLVDAGGAAERLLIRSRATLYVARALGGPYRLAAAGLGWLPARLGDWAYDRVAARRYAWFGRAEACRVATADERARFIDLAAGVGSVNAAAGPVNAAAASVSPGAASEPAGVASPRPTEAVVASRSGVDVPPVAALVIPSAEPLHA
jgi:predicted DCC family thiol-disulfide oxidoreductase YuxK